jgi:CopG family nickel-responsive transcriptional regulator
MTEKLVRFGVAMESSLLDEFDQLVETRGGTRSEALRDLARAAIAKAQVRRGVDAVGTLTLIYDHHVRDLTEKLTELQHDLGDKIRSTLHVHLDHEHCLEIIVMHGRSDELHAVAERILAIKGVLHGAIEIYAHKPSHGSHHEQKRPTPPARPRKRARAS